MSLITPVEFSELRNISKKLDNDKIEEAIGLAENSDLIDILGDFYFDVEANSAVAEWQDLLNGSSFVYCDENFKHKGIKALLADYSYSRFIYMGNVNLTPFGVQNKITQDSNPIERNQIKDIGKQAQIDGGIKFIYIEKYIMSDPILFSRYCKNKKQKTSFNSMKTSKL